MWVTRLAGNSWFGAVLDRCWRMARAEEMEERNGVAGRRISVTMNNDLLWPSAAAAGGE